MAPNVHSKEDSQDVYQYVELKTLPSFSKLQSQVQAVVRTSTWWDRYGVDWLYILVGASFIPTGVFCLTLKSWLFWAIGTFLLGCSYAIISNKAGHAAAHGALAASPRWNQLWFRLFIDFNGAFSAKMASDIHVKIHHPHTNIIGLGDSSTWKLPSLPRYAYMFVAPLTVPLLSPLVTIAELIKTRDVVEFIKWSTLAGCGFYMYMWIFSTFCGFSTLGSLLYVFAFRAVLGIPYIHINIFQHIGLPMFSQENRPVRIYQMSAGVLNLSRNPLLDLTFGHSLISCHVEHHLFPKLSDNMCLKVQPIVKSYLLEHGLTYHEDSYFNRVRVFLRDYEKLMVHAPPITHFVGLQ